MSRIVTSRPQRSITPDRRLVSVRRLSMIAVAAVAVLLIGSLVAGGADAFAGAAVGLVLVALFLLAGRLPFVANAQLGAGAGFLILGLNYLFRIVLLLVALAALRNQTWLDQRVVGVVVIVGALGWNVVALRRHLLTANAAAEGDAAVENLAEKSAVAGPGGQ
jgi:hypothetical protein